MKESFYLNVKELDIGHIVYNCVQTVYSHIGRAIVKEYVFYSFKMRRSLQNAITPSNKVDRFQSSFNFAINYVYVQTKAFPIL